MKPYLTSGLFMLAGLSLLLVTSGMRAKNSEGSAYSVEDSVRISQLKQRRLDLPIVDPGKPCPVTHGHRDTVPHAGYIFCSGCFWFGNGPAFLALAWSDQLTDEARFSLKGIPFADHAYRAKTPWVSRPDYSGPILIRGRRLDGNLEDKLRFSNGGFPPNDKLELEAPAPDRANSSLWSFWATSMFLPRAGCYGLQIDTNKTSDIVVFEMASAR